jgi:hypothetical protein
MKPFCLIIVKSYPVNCEEEQQKSGLILKRKIFKFIHLKKFVHKSGTVPGTTMNLKLPHVWTSSKPKLNHQQFIAKINLSLKRIKGARIAFKANLSFERNSSPFYTFFKNL